MSSKLLVDSLNRAVLSADITEGTVPFCTFLLKLVGFPIAPTQRVY